MELTRIDTIVQFTEGSTSTWSDVNTPVPLGVVIIDTVNRIMKEGDGISLYADLPVCLDYNFSGGVSGAVAPTGTHDGSIVIASNSTYTPHTVKLAEILNLTAARESVNATQQNRITGLNAQNVVAEVSPGVVDGTIVIVQGGKFAPGDRTLSQMIADLIAGSTFVINKMHIDDIIWYTDPLRTNRVTDQNRLTAGDTYYAKVDGFHDSAELRAVDFGLATATDGVTITGSNGNVNGGLFSAIYGGIATESFWGIAVDRFGNIFCCGQTTSEGALAAALVVKFDYKLNIVARRIYNGAGEDYFGGLVIDSNNNVIVIGTTKSEGTGPSSALVVKLDNSLNLAARKVVGGAGIDQIYSVAVDANDNIFTAGYTDSAGSGGFDAWVAKFDATMTMVASKAYGGTGQDYFWGITVNAENEVICVGQTSSEGPGLSSGLIVRFDNSLNLLARKVYGGATGDDFFYDVAVDPFGGIIAVGHSGSEGPGLFDALIVKFDTDLAIVARKVVGGSDDDHFEAVLVTSDNRIICGGYTAVDGDQRSAWIVEFAPNLSLVSSKVYGGHGNDEFRGFGLGLFDTILAVGTTSSLGSGGYDGLVVKLLGGVPGGTHTSSLGMVIADAQGMTIGDSGLTLTDSGSNLLNAPLTVNDSSLNLTSSALTLKNDLIVISRNSEATELLTTAYQSSGDDKLYAITQGNDGCIYAAGSTDLVGKDSGLILKLDAEYKVIARKAYTGDHDVRFYGVVTDSNCNPICVGLSGTGTGTTSDALIVKFDNTLSSILSHKTYGGSGVEEFNDVTVDPSGNFIAVGYTTSEGEGGREGLIVKFSSTLGVVQKKRYGGLVNDMFMAVATDVGGNTVVVGKTASEGTAPSGLVMKLDANLNVLVRKYYTSGQGTDTAFDGVFVSPTNHVYVAGHVVIGTGKKALAVRFDTNLTVSSQKLYGANYGLTKFTGVALDSAGNAFFVGQTDAEGAGSTDALAVKFTSTLNTVLGGKTYGSIGMDADIDCIVSPADDLVVSGYGKVGSSLDGVITKLPGSMPAGVYTNKILVDLILNDSDLELGDDSAVSGNSNLTMNTSVLTSNNSINVLSNAYGAVLTDVTVMDANPNVFTVEVGAGVVLGTSSEVEVTFNASAYDGKDVAVKDIRVFVEPEGGILVGVMGGGGLDAFEAVTTDTSNNIICAGSTASEGPGGNNRCLVVKFDAHLNVITRKVMGGSGDDRFYAVTTDTSNNIICAGQTGSEGPGSGYRALVVKFNSSLDVVARKVMGGTGADRFYGVVTDSSNNIICVGTTSSEGFDNRWLVVKFNGSLDIVARKLVRGANADYCYGVTTDSANNIICVGTTNSEGPGAGYRALVVKFNSSLDVVARKVMGGDDTDMFYGVTADSSNNIICAGYTGSEGPGTQCLVVKFNSSLGIVARKMMSAGLGRFRAVATDSADNIICAGYTDSEGPGAGNRCLVVKFNSSLDAVARKVMGGSGDDRFEAVTTDSSNNIICAGSTPSEGPGAGNRCLVVKFNTTLPSGTFAGTMLPGFSMTDSTRVIEDSMLAMTDSTLSITDSTLTIGDSTLAMTDSALEYVLDSTFG